MQDEASPNPPDSNDHEDEQRAVRDHLRARSASDWVRALLDDDTDAVVEALADRPGRANQFVTQPRPWGEEMWMPLHFAAQAGALGVAALLSEQGVSPMCRTRFATPMHARATPLHLAAEFGHDAFVAWLLEAEAEVDVLDARQERPLHLAARFGHAGIVRRLIGAGSALDPRNGNGRTPLHEGIRSADGVADDDANAASLALIEAGADINAACPKESDATTPLRRCRALGGRRTAVTDTLTERNADA